MSLFKEYKSYDACGLAKLVATKEVSAEELLETAVSIADDCKDLRAIAQPMHDFAKKAIADGLPEGPFRGVPYLLKDVLPLKGAPMSLGSVLLRNTVGTTTHEMIRRMQNTGLVIFGRTNMSELGLAPTAENDLYGATDNPWKRGYSTGGSSGGAGAAVAAGIVPMAHGGDGGGSIRIPASACGLVGLKPSRGRNPMEVFDEPNGVIQHGVLSRSVRDTAVMLDATQGNRVGDRFLLPSPSKRYSEYIQSDPRRLTIAYSTTDYTGRSADVDCVAAVQASVSLCRALGHEVVEARPDVDGQAFLAAFKSLWTSFAGYFFKQAGIAAQEIDSIPGFLKPLLHKPKVMRTFTRWKVKGVGAPSVGALTRRLGSLDDHLRSGDLWHAWTELRRAEVAVASFLTKYDLFLTPVLGSAPWKLGALDESQDLESLEAQLNAYAGYTPIANSGGFPALSLPLSISPNGLPIGSQFLAPLGREDRLLQLAAQIERSTPWTELAPGYE